MQVKNLRCYFAGPYANALDARNCKSVRLVTKCYAAKFIDRRDIQPICVSIDQCDKRNPGEYNSRARERRHDVRGWKIVRQHLDHLARSQVGIAFTLSYASEGVTTRGVIDTVIMTPVPPGEMGYRTKQSWRSV